MVNLTRIYTRTGDDGTTALGDFTRTQKTDPRLAAYADVDEANSAIGAAIALGNLDEDVVEVLRGIQNDLLDVGADLCTPINAHPDYQVLRTPQSYIDSLEAACDHYNASLANLRSFVLPGGTPGAALLHVARTITRRAERSVWHAVTRYGIDIDGGITSLTAMYLNRLSDLLFILARYANRAEGDVLWEPGRHTR